jgi:hypothetical protein
VKEPGSPPAAIVAVLALLLGLLGAGVVASIYKSPDSRRPYPDRPKVFLRDFELDPSGECRALLSLDLLRTQPSGECPVRRALYLATWPDGKPDSPKTTFIDEVHPGPPYGPNMFQGRLLTADGHPAVTYCDPPGPQRFLGGPLTSWVQTSGRFERVGTFPGATWRFSRDGRRARVSTQGTESVLLGLPRFADPLAWKDRLNPDEYFHYNDPLEQFLTNDGRFSITTVGVASKNPGKVLVVDLSSGTPALIQMASPDKTRPVLVDAEVVSGDLIFLVGYQREGVLGADVQAYALHDAAGKKMADLGIQYDYYRCRYDGRLPWDPANKRFILVQQTPDETALKLELVDYQGNKTQRKLILPKLSLFSETPAPRGN